MICSNLKKSKEISKIVGIVYKGRDREKDREWEESERDVETHRDKNIMTQITFVMFVEFLRFARYPPVSAA